MEKNNVQVDVSDMPIEIEEYPVRVFDAIEGHGTEDKIDTSSHLYASFYSGPSTDVLSEYSDNWDMFKKYKWVQKEATDKNFLIIDPGNVKKEEEEKCGYRAYVTRPVIDGLFFNDAGGLEKACNAPSAMLCFYRGIYGDMVVGPWNNGLSTETGAGGSDAVPVMKTQYVFNHAVVKEPLRAISYGLCSRFGVEYEKMKPMAPRTPWSLAIMLNACEQLEEYKKKNNISVFAQDDEIPFMYVSIGNNRAIKVESVKDSEAELGIVCTCTPLGFPVINFETISGCSPMGGLFLNAINKVVPIPPLLVYQSPLLCALFEKEKLELMLDWKDILGNLISFIIYAASNGRIGKKREKRVDASLAKLYDKIMVICNNMVANDEITADTLHLNAVRIVHVAEKIVMKLFKMSHSKNAELFSSFLRPLPSFITEYKRMCIGAREKDFFINTEIEHDITPPRSVYEWKNGDILAQKFVPEHRGAIERMRKIVEKRKEVDIKRNAPKEEPVNDNMSDEGDKEEEEKEEEEEEEDEEEEDVPDLE